MQSPTSSSLPPLLARPILRSIALSCLGLAYVYPASLAILHEAQFGTRNDVRAMICFFWPMLMLPVIAVAVPGYLFWLIRSMRRYRCVVKAMPAGDEPQRTALVRALRVQQWNSSLNLVAGVVLWMTGSEKVLVIRHWWEGGTIHIASAPIVLLWLLPSTVWFIFAHTESSLRSRRRKTKA